MQNSLHCHECDRIAEHNSGSQSLCSRQQQQRGAQVLKAQLKAQQHSAQLLTAEQSVEDCEGWPLVHANRASVLSRHAEADGGLSAQGGEAATLSQKQQQQLQQQLPISGVEAAEASKEAAEAWVNLFPLLAVPYTS